MCLWSINTDTRCSGFTLKISGPVNGPLCAFQLSSTNHSRGLCGKKGCMDFARGLSPGHELTLQTRFTAALIWLQDTDMTWKDDGESVHFFFYQKSQTLMVCFSFFVALKCCSRGEKTLEQSSFFTHSAFSLLQVYWHIIWWPLSILLLLLLLWRVSITFMYQWFPTKTHVSYCLTALPSNILGPAFSSSVCSCFQKVW